MISLPVRESLFVQPILKPVTFQQSKEKCLTQSSKQTRPISTPSACEPVAVTVIGVLDPVEVPVSVESPSLPAA